RLQSGHVGLRKAELRGALDGHDALAIAHREGERVERRGLATGRATRNEHASPLAHGADQIRHRIRRQGPVAHEVFGAERTLPEATDREDGPDKRYRWDHRVNAR